MDFPILLETQSFVTEKKEVEQQLELMLKNSYSDFFQNWNYGSAITPHIPNLVVLDIKIRAAIKRIRTVKLIDLQFKGDTVKIDYYSVYGRDTFFYENT